MPVTANQPLSGRNQIFRSAGAVSDPFDLVNKVLHGPVVEATMERGLVAHSFNSLQLDGFRDRYSAAGTKEDSRDTRLFDEANAHRDCRHEYCPEFSLWGAGGSENTRAEAHDDRPRLAKRRSALRDGFGRHCLRTIARTRRRHAWCMHVHN